VTSVTKWDLISEETREALEGAVCNLSCPGCGVLLVTEAEFAKHFRLYNPAYLNLGYCPVKGPGEQRW
jgi:hypothetical protein